jgi:hypothetical protein
MKRIWNHIVHAQIETPGLNAHIWNTFTIYIYMFQSHGPWYIANVFAIHGYDIQPLKIWLVNTCMYFNFIWFVNLYWICHLEVYKIICLKFWEDYYDGVHQSITYPSLNIGIQSNAPIMKAKQHITECSWFGQHSN